MRKLLIISLLFLLCLSCKTTKYVTVIQHDTTTVYKNRDVFLKDSIYVYKDRFIYTSGDTVYNNTIEYKDRWKIREVHDTAYKDRAIYIDREVPVEIEKKLTKIQKFFLAFGKLASILLLLGLGYCGYKLYRKFNIV